MVLKAVIMCTLLLLAEESAPETMPLSGPSYEGPPTAEALRENQRKLWLARRLFRTRDYDTAARLCEDILRVDPKNQQAQVLLEQCRDLLIEAKRRAMDREETHREDEAVQEVAEESQVPDELPDLPRPRVILRGRAAKSPEMERMNALLSQKVRLNFIDVDLDYLLNTLFKTSGVNIIADHNLLADKRLTLHVEDIPLRDILDFITRVHDDLAYTISPSGIWIVAKDKPILEERIYPLDTGLVAFGQMQTGGGFRRTTQDTTGRQGQPINAPVQQAQIGQGAQASNKSYLEEILDWMGGWSDLWPSGSDYYIDRKSNSLVVLTTPAMHDRVERVLDMVDRPPIQVLIRTKFIEISTTDTFDLGFSITNTEVGGTKKHGWDVGTGTNLGVSAGDGFNLVYSGFNTDPKFTAVLRALETDSRAKLLSAPQILALNNQKAVINLSTQFEVPTYEAASSTVTTNNQVTTVPTVFVPTGFETMEVGFFLEVTPSVGHDLKNIVIELHPLVDDVEGGTDRFQSFDIIQTEEQGTSTTQKVERPVIKRREVTTRLVVEDGGVVILGGLMRSRKEKVVKRVPVLGYLPILGFLFRSQSDTIEHSNLFIVVQANIVTPSGAQYEKPEAVFPAQVGAVVSPEEQGAWIFDYNRETEEALSDKRYPATAP